jgi:hypothetical protein
MSPLTSRSQTGVRRGRPPKFTRPSRIVKLTLPEDVVAALRRIDDDLSRAVVRLAEPLIGQAPQAATELKTFGTRSVIVVPPSQLLKHHAGVEFVPLPDGRALMCFDEGLPISEIELRIRDALTDSVEAKDRETFEALEQILRRARLADRVSVQRRSIIVLQTKPARPVEGDEADAPSDSASDLGA